MTEMRKCAKRGTAAAKRKAVTQISCMQEAGGAVLCESMISLDTDNKTITVVQPIGKQ
jgi:hypothetical protein